MPLVSSIWYSLEILLLVHINMFYTGIFCCLLKFFISLLHGVLCKLSTLSSIFVSWWAIKSIIIFASILKFSWDIWNTVMRLSCSFIPNNAAISYQSQFNEFSFVSSSKHTWDNMKNPFISNFSELKCSWSWQRLTCKGSMLEFQRWLQQTNVTAMIKTKTVIKSSQANSNGAVIYVYIL